jgi:hypothetical protein
MVLKNTKLIDGQINFTSQPAFGKRHYPGKFCMVCAEAKRDMTVL